MPGKTKSNFKFPNKTTLEKMIQNVVFNELKTRGVSEGFAPEIINIIAENIKIKKDQITSKKGLEEEIRYLANISSSLFLSQVSTASAYDGLKKRSNKSYKFPAKRTLNKMIQDIVSKQLELDGVSEGFAPQIMDTILDNLEWKKDQIVSKKELENEIKYLARISSSLFLSQLSTASAYDGDKSKCRHVLVTGTYEQTQEIEKWFNGEDYIENKETNIDGGFIGPLKCNNCGKKISEEELDELGEKYRNEGYSPAEEKTDKRKPLAKSFIDPLMGQIVPVKINLDGSGEGVGTTEICGFINDEVRIVEPTIYRPETTLKGNTIDISMGDSVSEIPEELYYSCCSKKFKTLELLRLHLNKQHKFNINKLV